MRVYVRFVGELNDLLSPSERGRTATAEVAAGTSVKDLIESLGVPHTEVDVITVNGQSVDFGRLCQEGDRVSVLPEGKAPRSGVLHLHPAPLKEPRFVLDVHLGRLARYLRLVGFDALWTNDLMDPELARISRDEDRILLTRDRGLLKRRNVTRAYFVRETERRAQVVEVLGRFDLFDRIEPFGRCLECNGTLVDVGKHEVEHLLPPRTRRDYHEFRRCERCRRVYWKGSHYDRLRAVVEDIRHAKNERAPVTAAPPMASAALAALERGWSVVPMHTPTAGRCSCGTPACPAPGKHPRVPWERFTHEAAPLAQVERWWNRWPRANLGVVTGPVSGLVVLDIDPRHNGGDRLAELERVHGTLPHTVEALTGGGGQHLYFRHPGGSLSSRPLAPGIDLKAGGGLVVSPPSTHATGRPYVWEQGAAPSECDFADLPPWLLRLALDPPRRSGTARERVPLRTRGEQAEFAELWRQVDVTVRHGDHTYLCPFHPDHHPSLHIDAEGCRFYCFGCARGGGIGRLRRLVGGRYGEGSSVPAGLGHPEEEHTTLSGQVQVRVVGTSEHQETLLELTGGRRHYAGAHVWTVAQLVPMSGSSGSPEVGVRIDGRLVGHLSGPDAERARDAIDSAILLDGDATCHALIVGGWEREHGDLGYFGVRLCLSGDP